MHIFLIYICFLKICLTTQKLADETIETGCFSNFQLAQADEVFNTGSFIYWRHFLCKYLKDDIDRLIAAIESGFTSEGDHKEQIKISIQGSVYTFSKELLKELRLHKTYFETCYSFITLFEEYYPYFSKANNQFQLLMNIFSSAPDGVYGNAIFLNRNVNRRKRIRGKLFDIELKDSRFRSSPKKLSETMEKIGYWLRNSKKEKFEKDLRKAKMNLFRVENGMELEMDFQYFHIKEMASPVANDNILKHDSKEGLGLESPLSEKKSNPVNVTETNNHLSEPTSTISSTLVNSSQKYDKSEKVEGKGFLTSSTKPSDIDEFGYSKNKDNSQKNITEDILTSSPYPNDFEKLGFYDNSTTPGPTLITETHHELKWINTALKDRYGKILKNMNDFISLDTYSNLPNTNKQVNKILEDIEKGLSQDKTTKWFTMILVSNIFAYERTNLLTQDTYVAKILKSYIHNQISEYLKDRKDIKHNKDMNNSLEMTSLIEDQLLYSSIAKIIGNNGFFYDDEPYITLRGIFLEAKEFPTIFSNNRLQNPDIEKLTLEIEGPWKIYNKPTQSIPLTTEKQDSSDTKETTITSFSGTKIQNEDQPTTQSFVDETTPIDGMTHKRNPKFSNYGTTLSKEMATETSVPENFKNYQTTQKIDESNQQKLGEIKSTTVYDRLSEKTLPFTISSTEPSNSFNFSSSHDSMNDILTKIIQSTTKHMPTITPPTPKVTEPISEYGFIGSKATEREQIAAEPITTSSMINFEAEMSEFNENLQSSFASLSTSTPISNNTFSNGILLNFSNPIPTTSLLN